MLLFIPGGFILLAGTGGVWLEGTGAALSGVGAVVDDRAMIGGAGLGGACFLAVKIYSHI